jgi:hypothetical protein
MLRCGAGSGSRGRAAAGTVAEPAAASEFTAALEDAAVAELDRRGA